MSQMKNQIVFDIDRDGNFCNGSLLFENGMIKRTDETKSTTEYDLDGISELCVFAGVGCGDIEMKKKGCTDDENVLLCSFSMSCMKQASEFCKMVNAYLKNGEDCESFFDDGRCPECGRPLAGDTKECIFCAKSSDVLMRAFKMFKPYYLSVLRISVILLFATGMTILTPLVQGKIVDRYFSNASALDFSSSASGLLRAVLMLMGLYIGGIALGMLSTILTAKTGCAFSHEMRYRLFDKIEQMSVSSVSRHTTGELIHRITRDTEFLMNFLIGDGSKLLEKTVTFLVVIVMLFSISPILTLLVLAPVPIAVVLFAKTNNTMRKNNALLWRTGSKETSALNDVIRGARVVKVFGNEELEEKKYAEVSGNFCKMSIINGRFWALFVEPVSFILSIGEILVLLVGGKMVLDGKISLGSFISFNLYLGYIYSPLRWMSGLPRRVSQAVTSLLKIFDILDEKDDRFDSENAITQIEDGDFEFNNVTFGYKSYEPVLKNINFKIKRGEMVGLVGHSGAGKSTMINLIIRLFDPDNGNITFGGTNLKDFNQQNYREKIGVVYQDTYLFAGTIYDNIVYAKRDASPDEVISAAKTANAHSFIMSLPDGYNTLIGENGYRLSGGERQRIAIARAVLRKPEILILDEATSALDPETEEQIQQALSRLVIGRTTVAIAHRLSTLRHADRLVVIENGEIAEEGTHVELLRKRGIYYNLVMAQKQLTTTEKK